MKTVHQSWEELYLTLRPGGNLGVCARGFECLATLIQGEPLTTFRLPDGTHHKNLCLICAREDVYRQYLEACTGNLGSEKIIQPWANVHGEYDHSYYLLPPRMDASCESIFVGIVAPFVRIPLNCYRLRPRGIVQTIDRMEGDLFIHWGDTQKRTRYYDPERFPGLYDLNFLILCSGLVVPPVRNDHEHVAMVNQALQGGAPDSNAPLVRHLRDHGMTLRQAIIFFVEDDQTLHQHVRSNHPQWDAFVRGECNLRLQGSNFWDRIFDRLKNKSIAHVERYDPELVKEGLVKLWGYYVKNPINTRIDVEETPHVWAFLRERYMRKSNLRIPLPLNLQTPTDLEFFVCKQCETLKALTTISNNAALRRKKKVKRHTQRKGLKRQGTNEILKSIYQDDFRCFRKRSGGRKAVANFYNRQNTGKFNCETPLSRVLFGKQIVHIRSVAHVCCVECSFVCHLNAEWIISGGRCNKCASPASKNVSCMICAAVKTNNTKVLNWFHIDTIVDGGRKPVERRWFCGRHTKTLENLDKGISSAPLLYKHILQSRYST
jgi:hypothetical protein